MLFGVAEVCLCGKDSGSAQDDVEVEIEVQKLPEQFDPLNAKPTMVSSGVVEKVVNNDVKKEALV